MNNYKHGNWYCKPANKAEAKEIIERAVVSGAELYETIKATGGPRYKWNLCSVWGVYNGRTHTSRPECNTDLLRGAVEYTIEQLREKFPLPGEKVTEWNGEGSPPIDIVCEKVYTSPDEYYRVKILANDDGEVVFRWLDGPNESDISASRQYQFGGDSMKTHMCFRPLRTTRERWVKDALNILQKDPAAMPAQLMGMIYDSLKSGDLKAPEVGNE